MEIDRAFSDAVAMARREPLLAIGVWAFLTIPSILANQLLSEGGAAGTNFVLGLAQIAAQIFFVQRCLRAENAIDYTDSGGRNFFVSVFGQGIISGLGILLGLVLLVIPGLFLMVRWSVSVVALIARNEGASEALQTSWDITKGHELRIFLVYLVAFAPFCAGFAVLFLAEPSLVTEIITESLLSISLVAIWYLSVAMYLQLSGDGQSQLRQTFA